VLSVLLSCSQRVFPNVSLATCPPKALFDPLLARLWRQYCLSVSLDGQCLRHDRYPTYLGVTLTVHGSVRLTSHLQGTPDKTLKNRNNLLMKLAGSSCMGCPRPDSRHLLWLFATLWQRIHSFIHLLRQEDSIKNTQVYKHLGLSINIAHSIKEQFSDSKRVQVINS